MTSTTELPRREPVRRARPTWLQLPGFWGAASICLMWLAVLFTAVYGGDAVFTGSDGTSTRLPAAVFVALFAFLASASVARRAFGSVPESSDERR